MQRVPADEGNAEICGTACVRGRLRTSTDQTTGRLRLRALIANGLRTTWTTRHPANGLRKTWMTRHRANGLDRSRAGRSCRLGCRSSKESTCHERPQMEATPKSAEQLASGVDFEHRPSTRGSRRSGDRSNHGQTSSAGTHCKRTSDDPDDTSSGQRTSEDPDSTSSGERTSSVLGWAQLLPGMSS